MANKKIMKGSIIMEKDKSLFTANRKGSIIMDDFKVIIELFAVGFIIAVLFYASGLTISEIFGFVGNSMLQILTGFTGLITQIIVYIIGGIISAISSALSFVIHIL